jgi:hypothetical protein
VYDSCYWLRVSYDELEDGFPEKKILIRLFFINEMFIINLRKFNNQSSKDILNE